jgi:hypothetical protein
VMCEVKGAITLSAVVTGARRGGGELRLPDTCLFHHLARLEGARGLWLHVVPRAKIEDLGCILVWYVRADLCVRDSVEVQTRRGSICVI